MYVFLVFYYQVAFTLMILNKSKKQLDSINTKKMKTKFS